MGKAEKNTNRFAYCIIKVLPLCPKTVLKCVNCGGRHEMLRSEINENQLIKAYIEP